MSTRLLTAGALAAGLVGASPALADESFEVDSGGLTFEGSDDFEVNIGGRMHVDTAAYDDDITQFEDRTEARRLRLETSIRFTDRLRARVDYDFAPGSDGWRNVWLSYEITDDLLLRAGNQIVPFSMEDMASSNELTFMERALSNAFAPGYGMAAHLRARGEGWTAAAAYFEEPIGTETEDGSDDVTAGAVRVTYAPIHRNNHVLHFGLAGQTQDFADGAEFRIRLRPESGPANNRLLDTSTLSGVSGFDAYNFEAAYMRGPFSIQGEYSRLELERTTRADPTFHAGYVQVSYVLTGQRRDYSESSGVLGGVDLDDDDRHAFEIAARYSMADLDSETVTGGQENNWTLGANWYVNRNIRLMANYIRAEAQPNRNGDDETLNIWQARVQFAF